MTSTQKTGLWRLQNQSFPDNFEHLDVNSVISDSDNPEQDLLRVEYKRQLKKILEEGLSPRESQVMILRFYHEKTLQQISDMYDITTERVHQIESKALRRLRHKKLKNKILDLNQPSSI